MGAAYFIVAESNPEGADLFVNGKTLAREEAKIEAASRDLGVKNLMEFFSQNPDEAAEFLDEDLSELPAETWFEAAEGLKTVRALLAHFAEQEALVEDLKEFETVLACLQSAGIRWHLSVDF